jgi:VanZ family protein
MMKKFFAITFFLFLLLVAYWADTDSMPKILSALTEFPYGDKIGHFILYGILAYLLTVAMPFRRVKILRWSLPLGLVLAAGFASLEEISQLFFVNRTASFVDLFSGYIGIAAAAVIIPCLRGACLPVSEPSDL